METSLHSNSTLTLPPPVPNSEPPQLNTSIDRRISGSFVEEHTNNSMASVNAVDFISAFNDSQGWKPAATKDPWSNQSSSSSSGK